MKVKELDRKEKVFEPIRIEIVIETKDELCAMWHRLNIPYKNVKENSNYIKGMDPDNADVHPFWRLLNECAIDLGYKH